MTLDRIAGGCYHFSSQGLNHYSLIGDLNPGDLAEMDPAQCVGGLGLPRLFSLLLQPFIKKKVVRSCREDFQVTFFKPIYSFHKHPPSLMIGHREVMVMCLSIVDSPAWLDGGAMRKCTCTQKKTQKQMKTLVFDRSISNR